MNISKYRIETALSQRELAKQLHVSPVAVHNWEVGKCTPRFSNLKKMAEIFNCTIDDLAGTTCESR